jgi:hypothetical protein
VRASESWTFGIGFWSAARNTARRAARPPAAIHGQRDDVAQLPKKRRELQAEDLDAARKAAAKLRKPEKLLAAIEKLI